MNGTPPIPLLHQLIAEQMRHELASRRLDVVLVPSPVEYWPTGQQRRVVCERNPGWYRELCRQYPSNRARPRRRAKPDTLIKRRHVLRALAEIEDGRLESEYARRIYPFVASEAEKYVQQHQRLPANTPPDKRSSTMHTATNPLPSKNALPRDLRGGGPTEAGGGKTYPVDPKAVERLKAHMAKSGKKTAETAVASDAPTARPGRVFNPAAFDPAALYSSDVIAAAKEQMAKPPKSRRYGDVLTPEVLAVWHKWHQSGIQLRHIAQNNGLIELRPNALSTIMKGHRESLEAGTETAAAEAVPVTVSAAEMKTAVVPPLRLSDEPIAPPAETETAVSEPEPEPEIESIPTAVAPFAVERPENLPTFFDREYTPQRPRPGDALSALVQLLQNDEQVKVKGSVKLNLEIEFGE